MAIRIDPVVNEHARNLPVTVIHFHDGPMADKVKPVRGTPRASDIMVSTDRLTGEAVAYACRRVDFRPWDLTCRGLSSAYYETFHYYPADQDEIRRGGDPARL